MENVCWGKGLGGLRRGGELVESNIRPKKRTRHCINNTIFTDDDSGFMKC